jgi:hypothetical protein
MIRLLYRSPLPGLGIAQLCCLLTLMLSSFNSIAQTESPGDKLISGKFRSFYNAGQYDSIFNMYAAGMQKSYPINTTNAFYTKLNYQAGKMVDMIFEKYVGSSASYRTILDRALYSINIAADKEQKISTFSLRPYEPDSFPAKARNSTALKLPFKMEWTVTWGGDTKEQNQHIGSRVQKNALDFVNRWKTK